MSVTSWSIIVLLSLFLGFFSASALCVARRDEEIQAAYKQGIKKGLSQSLE